MESGDRTRVNIPAGILLEVPWSDFCDDWKNWIAELSSYLDFNVTLIKYEDMPTAYGAYEGWDVDSIIEPSERDTSRWLPSEWLSKLNTIGYCNACGGVKKHRLMCPTNKEK